MRLLFVLTSYIGLTFGICAFLKGFLMNRSEIYNIAYCDGKSDYCHYSPYKRVVILLVDALKFEFMDPTLNKSKNKHYQGQLDIINSVLMQKNVFPYVAHFKSDPPTTTLQRIKGLTTGSLPTFVDIGSNFGSSELKEDNIVHQWVKSQLDVKFVGDETWMDLFPVGFNKSEPYPSFNVKDLDSVDRKVEDFILKSLAKKSGTNEKPEVIIGHMLGIDHCGHTFGKNHRQMKRKLLELDKFLKTLIREHINKDTIFIMFGDHGMTLSGDHGGDSDEEVDAGLFVVSGKRLNYHKNGRSPLIAERMNQIDLVPTLAAITGVSIPFSNLGVLNTDLIVSLGRAQYFADQNVKQIRKYVETYEQEIGKLDLPENLNQFLHHYENLSLINIDENLINLQQIQHHFKSKWVRFNVFLMICGVVCCLLHLIAMANILIIRIKGHQQTIPLIHLIYLISSILLITTNCEGYYLLFFLLLFVSFFIKEFIQLTKSLSLSSICNTSSVIIVLSAIINTLIPFSNSYIVSEPKVLQFLLQSILVIIFIQSVRPTIVSIICKKHRTKTTTIISKIISSKVVWFLIVTFTIGSFCLSFGLTQKTCREEEHQCIVTNVTRNPWPLVLIPVVIAFYTTWMYHAGNSRNVLFIKYAIPLAGICLFFHQTIQLVEQNNQHNLLPSSVILLFPRAAILLSVFVLISLFVSPLMMTMVHQDASIPMIYQLLRGQQQSVVVQGLGSVYSATMFTGMMASIVLVSTLMTAHFTIGLVAVFGALFAYSVLVAMFVDVRFSDGNDKDSDGNNADSERDIFQSLPTFQSTVFITILGQYGIFATGHQTTITAIPWYAAFIGWHGHHGTYIIPTIMINLNLFSVPFVLSSFGVLFPLWLLLSGHGPANPFRQKHRNDRFKSSSSNSNVVTYLETGDFQLFHTNRSADRFIHWAGTCFLSYGWYQSVTTFASVLAAFCTRRHLMAWKIFVPRMLYSVTGLMVVYVALIIGYGFVVRLHRVAVRWRMKNI